MLQTFCIKSNNKNINNYIIQNLKKFKMSNIYFSVRDFALYTNIIIHYKGEEINKFRNKLSNLLTNTTIIFYNKYLIKNLINTNYFYFSDYEKSRIYEYCLENSKDKNFIKRKKYILNKIYKNYFLYNKKMNLNGFINFSIRDYISLLDNIVDQSVNNFIIEKEYIEFIDLIKSYVNSKDELTDKINLIYINNTSYLYDKNFELIPCSDISKYKYLSDINFSSNDYCLNTLLNLLPKTIDIYSNEINNEFLKTLSLIFEDRVIYKPLPIGTGNFGNFKKL